MAGCDRAGAAPWWALSQESHTDVAAQQPDDEDDDDEDDDDDDDEDDAFGD